MDERQHQRHGYDFQRDDDDDRGRRRFGMGEQMRGRDDDQDEGRSRMGGSMDWGYEGRRGRERGYGGRGRGTQGSLGREWTRDWGEAEMGRSRRGHAAYPYGYDEDQDMPRGMMRGEGRERGGWESGQGEWERGFEGRGAGFGYGSHAGRGYEREFGGRGHMQGSTAQSEWRDRGRFGGGGYGYGYGEEEGRFGEGRFGRGQYGQSQGGYGRSFAGESGGMGIQSRMRGMGPKNYRRSDERIREDVCEMLEDADLDASEIDVKVREGEVTLEGSVKDRWSKREAEDVVCQVRGVRDCHNQLRLEQRSQQAQSGRGNGRTSTNA